MKTRKTYITFIFSLILGLGGVLLYASDNPERKKARYYFLEGAREAAFNRQAEAYEYFRKAYETDPTYEDAAGAYGSLRLFVRTDTLQSDAEIERTLRLMQQYVDAFPADLYAGQMYGYVTSRLDTVEESIRVLERMTTLKPKETYLLMNLADVYMMARRYPDAVEAINRYESIEGKNQSSSLKKMSFLLAGADTIGAINEASELIATNPRNPANYVLKGNLFEVIGKPDSTLFYLKKAEEISPDNGAVKMALATYYKETGDSVAFDNAVYDGLLSEDFELEEKIAILGDYLQTLIDEKGETGRGDHLFDVLSEQYPHEPILIDLMARYNGAKGDFDQAAEQISYAIDLDPANTGYWLQKMRYEMAAEKPQEAMKTYEEAESHITVAESMTLLYAAAASENNDFQKSEEAYAKLIHSSNPNLPLWEAANAPQFRNSLSYDDLQRLSTFYNMLGDMYFKAGDIQKTFGAYDNSLYFFPDNALTLNNYAYFLAETGGDLDRALQMSRKALDADDTNPTFIDTYAWILFKRKEYKEALQYQELAIDFAETNEEGSAEYYHHMGDILFMNHQPSEAVEYWEKALLLEPDNELLKKKVEHKTFFFE